MVNYQNGKVYKIISEFTDKIYIGSTAQKYLSRRLSKHRSEFKTFHEKRSNAYVSSFDILIFGGCQIILLENFPCNNKDELRAQEQSWIEKSDNCVNKQRAIQTPEQLKLDKQQYYEDNKEHIKEMVKGYRAKNLEKIKEYQKEYGKGHYQKNKETILEKQKLKMTCDCGSVFRKADLAKHLKTKKHLEWVASQKVTEIEFLD